MARRASYKPPKPRMRTLKAIKMPKLKSLLSYKTFNMASNRTKVTKGLTQEALLKKLSKIKQFKLPKADSRIGRATSTGQLISRLRTLTRTGISSGRRFTLH